MRVRNRKVLQDKTPVNSPSGKKKSSPPRKAREEIFGSTKKLSAVRGVSATPTHHHISRLGIPPEERMPSLTELVAEAEEEGEEDEEEEVQEDILAPLREDKSKKTKSTRQGPTHSSPAALRPKRDLRAPSKPATTASSAAQKKRAMSPLPPSSPFSAVSSVGVDDAEPPFVIEDDVIETVTVEETKTVEVEPSDEDPFGFLEVEKKLKEERDRKKKPAVLKPVPALTRVMKKPATTSSATMKDVKKLPVASTSTRAPLETLSLAAEDESSAFPIPRDGTPFRYPSSDDDLYAEPEPVELDGNKENIPQAGVDEDESEHAFEDDEGVDENEDPEKENAPPRSRARPPQAPIPEEEEEEQLPPVQEEDEESESYPSPPRTPHPVHVSRGILPISSPFSSRSSPCDRDIAVESAPSSPSPTKPLTIVRSLTRPKVQGLRYTGTSSSPRKPPQSVDKGKRKAVPEPSASVARKKPRLSSEEPAAPPSPTLVSTTTATKKENQNIPGKKRAVRGRKKKEVVVEDEDPMVYARNLEKLLPKRPARKTTSNISPTKAKGKGKDKATTTTGRVTRSRTRKVEVEVEGIEESDIEEIDLTDVAADDEEEDEVTEEDEEEPKPTTKGRKRKAPAKSAKAKGKEPATKRVKPTAKTTKGKAKATTGTSKAKDKGKGKAKELDDEKSFEELSFEDEVRGSESSS
ncbi:hypothetical protein ABKN59_010276 [Abortiporus biennis]